MATLKYVANEEIQTVTLGSDYTAGDGSLVLATGQGALLPSSGDFWIRSVTPFVMFLVTSRSSDTLTVTAAQDGTTDQDLPAGTTLHWTLGVSALDRLRVDICQTGANSSKQVNKAGSLYLPNDSPYIYRDTGAAFAAWGPLYPCGVQDFSGFTDVNSPTKSTAGGLFNITAAAAAGNNVRAVVTPTPSTPYTLTVGIFFYVAPANFSFSGALWMDSASGKLDAYGPTTNIGQWIYRIKYNTATSFNALGLNNAFSVGVGRVFLRLADNGTNRTMSFSMDGYNYIQTATFVRTDFLTPDRIGVFTESNNATNQSTVTVFSWSF